jgi:thiol reductant ABC exporter CydC subunit
VSSTLVAVIRLGGAPRLRLLLAGALGAATVLFGVGLMASAGYLIARAAEQPPVLSLMTTIVAVRFFGLGRPIVRYADRLASHDVALRVLGNVRAAFYQRIEPLAPAGLDCYRRGELLSRAVADVDAIQNLYLRGIGPPIVALAAGAVAVGVSAVFLPAAAVVLGVGLLAGGIAVPAVSGALAARAGRAQAAARGALAAEVVELVDGSAELVAFGADGEILAGVRAVDDAYVANSRRDALATGIGDGLNLLVTGCTVAGVLAVAVAATADGRLDRVLVAMLALLALASFEAVTPLADAARALSATLAAGSRVLGVTAGAAAVSDPPRPAPAPVWPFTIALECVSAGYPGQPRPALDGLDLRLAAGERVAMLGPSGAGKTTVANLLLRFLDAECGRVTIAGRDIREYRQADVRRVISVAGQDSHLFAASIAANVRLARPAATDQDVESALRRARIWDWVRGLPDGAETLVGEQGRALSGGQRQRIVLARALLADAPLLVLDEPTAHLDHETAERLMRDVFAAAEGRTVLLITHRPEGLDLVDRFVRLPHGDVV